MNKNNGFTLIELLVVIAIIGILASVVLSSLNSARDAARDAKRASEVRQLKIALELYRNQNTTPYNTDGNPICIGMTNAQNCWGGDALGSTDFNNVMSAFMSSMPSDPTPGRFYGAYTYKSPGSYWLPAPVGTVNGGAGSYAIMWQPENGATVEKCSSMGGTYGKWVGNCPSGGSCRQCGIIVQ